MKKITMTLALLLFLQLGFSQTLSQYTFSQSNGTYTAISGGTVLGNTASDDERFLDPAVPLGGNAFTGVGLPIGFNFVFNGTTYDRFAVNTNGWISLGSSTFTPAVDMNSSSSYTPLSSTSTVVPSDRVARIAGFSRDLQAQAGSEIRYELIGVAPNRVLVVQWKNYAKYLALGDSFNFQIRLQETTNAVAIVYGTMTNNATPTTADCGLRAAPNNPASNFSNRSTATDWNATTAGTTAAATVLLSNTIAPTSGLTFAWTPPPSCTGAPNPGNTIVPSATACAAVPFNVSLQNATSGSGVTYQWLVSTDNITYTNASGISNAEAYNASQTVATYYKCVVTCTASGQSAESTPVLVGMTAPNACYCVPIYTVGKTDGDLISNIVINGTTLSNNSGTNPVNPAYTYFTGQPNFTADLQAGGTYTVSVTVGTFGNQNMAAWIDYNDNGVFETNERVGFTTTAIGANGTATFTITLACNPPLGTHRMRIRDVWNTPGNTIDPCASYGYGETEDYDVTITTAVACPQPSNIITTNITTTSATMGWTAGCTETQWVIYVTPNGGAAPSPGAGTVVTTNPFVLTGLTPNTLYDIYISAICGPNESSLWTGPFSFRTLIPPPANDDCVNAIALTVGTNVNNIPITTTNVSATNSNPPAPGCAAFTGGDVWFTVTVPASGSVTLETNALSGSAVTDTGMAVYSGTCGALTLLACDDDSSTNGNFSLISLNGLNPGQVLYVNAWEYLNDAFGEFLIAAYDCASTTPAPTGDAVVSFCGNGFTVANLFANGTSIQWYATPTGGTPLSASTILVDGASYYASQTLDCESFQRLQVTVDIVPLPVLSDATLTLCDLNTNSTEVVDLTSAISLISNETGLTYSFYLDLFDAENLVNEIPNPTAYVASNGETIFVVGQNNLGCTSIVELVLVVTAPSAAPSGNPTQDYCTTATIDDLSVVGTQIVWYDSATGGNVLPTSTPLVDGATYFASQNELGCESTSRLAVTVNDICATTACLDTPNGIFPTQTFTPACIGAAQAITTVGWAGEYSNVNVTAGVQYTFTSSIASDFITIANTDATLAYTSGITPVTWTATVTGVIRFITHADDQCSDNQDERTRAITCGTPPPLPNNDSCATPTALTVGGVYADQDIDTSNLGATLSAETPAPTCGAFGFATSGKDVWYSFVVPASGNATIETAGTSTGGAGIDTVLQAYIGDCAVLTAVGCDDDGAPEVAVGHSRLVLTGLTPGVTVLVRAFGYNGGQGNFGLSVYDASLNTIGFNDVLFTAYPNPVKDILQVSASEPIDRIEVITMLGQSVWSQTIQATASQIDLSQLPAGTYLVRATVNQQVKTLKVIKQ
jgi:hypothetical protein